ncbi:MAG: response regulator [Patescibacteria group bacterium]
MAGKAKILVADDDVVLRDMYKARLEDSGYEIITASNGEEAMARATDSSPDLILLDVMMPKVNGFDCLDMLKSTAETKKIPVVILTALVQDSDRERGVKGGADDYIVKSETMPGEIIEKIEKLVKK